MNQAAYLLANIFVSNTANIEANSSLLSSVSENVSHESLHIKKAAIMTLSTICELLAENDDNSLSDD